MYMQYTPNDEPSIEREDNVEYDDAAVTDTDERAKGATWFDPDDAEIGVHMSTGPDQDRWERLRDVNDGSGSSSRREDIRVATRVMDAEFVAEECGLGEREQNTVKRLVKSIDFRFGPYIATEDVILGIVFYVGTATNNPCDGDRLIEFANDWDVDVDTIDNIQTTIESKIS